MTDVHISGSGSTVVLNAETHVVKVIGTGVGVTSRVTAGLTSAAAQALIDDSVEVFRAALRIDGPVSDVGGSITDGVATIGILDGEIPAGLNILLESQTDPDDDGMYVSGGGSTFTYLPESQQPLRVAATGYFVIVNIDLATLEPFRGVVASLDGGVTMFIDPLASDGVALSDDDPEALGTPDPGDSSDASRSDHVHALPTAGDVGAATPANIVTAVDASEDQTLAARTRWMRDQPEWVSTFESGHGWTFQQSGTLGSATDDTDDPIFGEQSVRIEVPEVSVYGRIRSIGNDPIDATGKCIVAWIRTPDVTKVNQFYLHVGSGNLANNKLITNWTTGATVPTVNGRWTPIRFSIEAASTTSGTFDRTAITDYQLSVYSGAGGDAEVNVGAIGWVETNPAFPDGVVTFTYDDNLTSQVVAQQHLDQFGFPGVLYTIVERIGGVNSLTLEQITNMHRHSGWEIAGHAFTDNAHTNRMTSLTADELDEELRSLKGWLAENGFASESFCQPGGVYNEATQEAAERYFHNARTTSQWPPYNLPGYVDPMYLTQYDPAANLTVAKQWVDRAVADGLWVIFMIHDVATSLTPEEHLELVEYVAASGVPVRTIQQVQDAVNAGAITPDVGGAVDSVDGRTGAVTLDDLYAPAGSSGLRVPITPGSANYNTGGNYGSPAFRADGAAYTQALTLGYSYLAYGDRTTDADLTHLLFEVTASSLSAGQSVNVVCYEVTAEGLPGELFWSESIEVGTGTGVPAGTSLGASSGLQLPDGGYYIGIHNPSGNAGTVTMRALRPIDGPYGNLTAAIHYRGINDNAGATPTADLTGFNLSAAPNIASRLGLAENVPAILLR